MSLELSNYFSSVVLPAGYKTVPVTVPKPSHVVIFGDPADRNARRLHVYTNDSLATILSMRHTGSRQPDQAPELVRNCAASFAEAYHDYGFSFRLPYRRKLFTQGIGLETLRFIGVVLSNGAESALDEWSPRVHIKATMPAPNDSHRRQSVFS